MCLPRAVPWGQASAGGLETSPHLHPEQFPLENAPTPVLLIPLSHPSGAVPNLLIWFNFAFLWHVC